MPISNITVAGATLTLCALPSAPSPAQIEPWISDNVASVESPFTGQVQTQSWPGADAYGMTVTLPPLHRNASPWIAFLMQMRGIERVVQLPWFPQRVQQGNAGGSLPVVATSGSANLPMSRTLVTRGWLPLRPNVLMPGDAIQIGYRMHFCLDAVTPDAGGNATFEIFPSLRELPADGTPIILNSPQGLFRLAGNKRSWSRSLPTTSISFQLQEYR